MWQRAVRGLSTACVHGWVGSRPALTLLLCAMGRGHLPNPATAVHPPAFGAGMGGRCVAAAGTDQDCVGGRGIVRGAHKPGGAVIHGATHPANALTPSL